MPARSGARLLFPRSRPLRDLLLDLHRVLRVGRNLEIFRVSVARAGKVLDLLVGLAELEESFSRPWVPTRCLEITFGGGPVITLLEIEVAGRDIPLRFQRIQSILFRLERLVFFGRFYFFRLGLRWLQLLRILRRCKRTSEKTNSQKD